MQNQVNMHGRLVRDPVLKETQSGSYMCLFSIAVTRNWADANGNYNPDYFSCKAFGRTAQNISKFFVRGSEIVISGRLEMSKTMSDSGKNNVYYNIVVNEFDFCGNKSKQKDADEDAAPVTFEPLPDTDEGLPF